MKVLWNVFVGFVLINLLAAAGFVGWMYADGRINRERIDKVVETFSMTIEAEESELADVEAKEAENQKLKEQQARLESTAKGPVTLGERLDTRQQADETFLANIQLINDQNRALRDEITRFKEDFTQREAKLAEERAAFEKWVQDQADKTKDENFLQVVSLYEKQPPKQTKQAFQSLMQQGETSRVVDYLAAMSSRKAAAVLEQFKTPEEVPQAANLLEQLRTRGQYNLQQPQASLPQD